MLNDLPFPIRVSSISPIERVLPSMHRLAICLSFWALIFLAGCSEPPQPKPVTVAFPLSENQDYAAITEFQDILLHDGKKMVRDPHLEGIPKADLRIRVDSTRWQTLASAYGLRKSDIVSVLPRDIHWEVSADSFDIQGRTIPKRTRTKISDLELLILNPKPDQQPIYMRDIAVFLQQNPVDQIMVNDEPCIVIRGTTTRSQSEIDEWLHGLDSQLGVSHFIVLGN